MGIRMRIRHQPARTSYEGALPLYSFDLNQLLQIILEGHHLQQLSLRIKNGVIRGHTHLL